VIAQHFKGIGDAVPIPGHQVLVGYTWNLVTTEQVGLIRDSFVAIQRTSSPLALLFYGRMFELDPSLRVLFKIDLVSQSKKLTDTLLAVADSLHRFDEMRPVLRDLGRKHVEYGVRPEHYLTLTEAMLWALRQALQEDFDDQTRAAWVDVLEEINREMLAGSSA
jgi:hemoglobin-like flavoprotein